jgi:hypothetical protein
VLSLKPGSHPKDMGGKSKGTGTGGRLESLGAPKEELLMGQEELEMLNLDAGTCAFDL